MKYNTLNPRLLIGLILTLVLTVVIIVLATTNNYFNQRIHLNTVQMTTGIETGTIGNLCTAIELEDSDTVLDNCPGQPGVKANVISIGNLKGGNHVLVIGKSPLSQQSSVTLIRLP